MSPSLESVYISFLYHRVPKMWEDAGYPCLKPLRSWIEDFFLRITTLQSWVYEGPKASYWLSGLFFPQGFLTSVLQMYARDNSVAIDLLGFTTEVCKFYVEDVAQGPNMALIFTVFLCKVQSTMWPSIVLWKQHQVICLIDSPSYGLNPY